MSTRWGLVLVIWAAGLGAAGQYAKVSVVFDRLAAMYPQAGTALGFTVSLVGVIGILFGILAGAIVAAMGFRRTLVWCLWVGSAVSVVQSLGLPFDLFLISRVIEGISHLGLVVAAPTLIAQISAERHRGFTLTLWGTFFGVAFTLLVWFGLPLVDRHGVLSLFAVHAAYMALLAIALGLALRNLPAQDRAPMPSLRTLPRLHAQAYSSPRIAAPAAGWLFYTTCFLAILTVIPPYIDPAIRAFVMGAMPLTSIAVSMTVGVVLLRYLTAVQVIMVGFAICAVCTIGLLAWPGSPAMCLSLAAGLGLVQGATFASVPQLNASVADRARANGALAQAGNLGNTLGTPLMVLLLVSHGYSGMMVTSLVVFLGGIAIHAALAALRRRL